MNAEFILKQYKIYISKFSFFILCIFCLSSQLHAQPFVSKLITLNDTTLAQFTDINQLYFLHNKRQHRLKKLVHRLSVTSKATRANKIIQKIAALRSDESIVVLSLDYYFQRQSAVQGSNVERVLSFLQSSEHYQLINTHYFQQKIPSDLSKDSFMHAVQNEVGWRYGMGAFNFLSAEDSFLVVKMKQHNMDKDDANVKKIITHYLRQQQHPFQYPVDPILKDVLKLPHVIDAQWDRCLIKTEQLPNWDHLGVSFLHGKDTIERIYTIQYSKSTTLHFGHHVQIPLRTKTDILWYKGARFGLHFIDKTRKQCEENNRIRHR